MSTKQIHNKWMMGSMKSIHWDVFTNKVQMCMWGEEIGLADVSWKQTKVHILK